MRDRLIELTKASLMRHIDKSCRLAENIADDLLANGIVVPPCKLGDRIYYIDSTNFIDCEVVKQISFNHHGKWLVLLDHSCISFDEIGKKVFLTREEAEKALKERSENGK